MPIHINLLAENQAIEEMRRRDPFKRALSVGIILVVLFVVWGGWVTGKSLVAKEQFTGLQGKINALTNNFQHAKADINKVTTAKTRLAKLDQLQGARFLQGNLLNAMQLATIDGVQLNRLIVDQSFQPIGEPKPTKVTEHIVLRLYARDFSANPGDLINKFRETVSRQSYFQGMLDKTNNVQLVGSPSPPSTDASANGKPYVAFTFECRFRDQTR